MNKIEKNKIFKISYISEIFCLMLFGLVFSRPVSATPLTYQKDVPVSFTFNPSISVSVSSDLHIYNLTPGTTSDSNIITVYITTNNSTGYVLTATVGNESKPTTNLTNGTYNFTNLATTSDLADMSSASDNTWGYSFSQDDGTNWTNYSGLPLYTATGKELLSSNTFGNTSIKFKIGAKASASQPSGTYNNIINFVAVTNPLPKTISDVTYMQEFKSMSADDLASVKASMTEDTQYTLTDNRDNKTYYVAKLKDGNVWMTQNLDLDLNSSTTYTDSNTDIGYNTSTGTYDTASWTPNSSTVATIGSWVDSTTVPSSYNPGDLYWNGVFWPTNQADCTAASGTWNNNTCENPVLTSSTGIGQYHLGNYYNWTAAVAMNDSSSHTTGDELIEQSVCPAGWTLPRSGTGDDSFQSIWAEYGFDGWSTNGNDNLWSSPFYLVFSGYSRGGALENMGSMGYLWSPVVESNYGIYGAYFDTEFADAYSSSFAGDYGFSVRCIARPVTNQITGL